MAKKRKALAKTKARRRPAKKNPALKTLKKTTGWMKASAVKILRNGGVLIRKPKPKRNPAKKKLPVKRYPAYKRTAKRAPAKRKTAAKRKRR